MCLFSSVSEVMSPKLPFGRVALVPSVGWLATGLLCLSVLPACKKTENASKSGAPQAAPAVTVAKPIARKMQDWDEFTGRLASREMVEIRARVSGYLTKVDFKEGAEVKSGDLLFTIDPRPYEAAVQRAEALLAQAKTTAELANIEAKNATTLRQGQAISVEESERRLKGAAGEQAAVRGAEAALRSAQLDLEFTQIRAPISGRISNARVTEGNLVTGGTRDATLLTTIVALDPIYCYIDVDERSSLKYRQMYKAGERKSALFGEVPAEMALINQEGWPHKGAVDFVDNQLNPATGTIQARAVFPNADRLMSPGFFAKVRIPGSGAYEGLLIRDLAVGDDQGSSYVWVLDAEDQVVYRPVELGPLLDSMRVVRKGLTTEDRVLITGLMAVRNGVKVVPTLAEMEPKKGEAAETPQTPAAASPPPAAKTAEATPAKKETAPASK